MKVLVTFLSSNLATIDIKVQYVNCFCSDKVGEVQRKVKPLHGCFSPSLFVIHVGGTSQDANDGSLKFSRWWQSGINYYV